MLFAYFCNYARDNETKYMDNSLFYEFKFQIELNEVWELKLNWNEENNKFLANNNLTFELSRFLTQELVNARFNVTKLSNKTEVNGSKYISIFM